MNDIHSNLDGIKNAIQQLDIQASESNIRIIMAIINTIGIVKEQADQLEHSKEKTSDEKIET